MSSEYDFVEQRMMVLLNLPFKSVWRYVFVCKQLCRGLEIACQEDAFDPMPESRWWFAAGIEAISDFSQLCDDACVTTLGEMTKWEKANVADGCRRPWKDICDQIESLSEEAVAKSVKTMYKHSTWLPCLSGALSELNGMLGRWRSSNRDMGGRSVLADISLGKFKDGLLSPTEFLRVNHDYVRRVLSICHLGRDLMNVDGRLRRINKYLCKTVKAWFTNSEWSAARLTRLDYRGILDYRVCFAAMISELYADIGVGAIEETMKGIKGSRRSKCRQGRSRFKDKQKTVRIGSRLAIEEEGRVIRSGDNALTINGEKQWELIDRLLFGVVKAVESKEDEGWVDFSSKDVACFGTRKGSAATKFKNEWLEVKNAREMDPDAWKGKKGQPPVVKARIKESFWRVSQAE